MVGEKDWPNLRRIVSGKKPLKPWDGASGAGPFSSLAQVARLDEQSGQEDEDKQLPKS